MVGDAQDAHEVELKLSVSTLVEDLANGLKLDNRKFLLQNHLLAFKSFGLQNYMTNFTHF